MYLSLDCDPWEVLGQGLGTKLVLSKCYWLMTWIHDWMLEYKHISEYTFPALKKLKFNGRDHLAQNWQDVDLWGHCSVKSSHRHCVNNWLWPCAPFYKQLVGWVWLTSHSLPTSSLEGKTGIEHVIVTRLRYRSLCFFSHLGYHGDLGTQRGRWSDCSVRGTLSPGPCQPPPLTNNQVYPGCPPTMDWEQPSPQ